MRIEFDCVFNFGFLIRMKSISLMRQSSFPWHFLQNGELLQKLGVGNSVATFHMCTNGSGSIFFNSRMEMTSSGADIICIAQITFKLIYNTLPANDGWFSVLNSKFLANFWTREYRLYWTADVVAKIFELFSDEVRRSLIFER